jgi:ligand-binding sensor domain-containing protein
VSEGPTTWAAGGPRAALAFLAAALCAVPATALDPQRSTTQYALRAWTKRDGLPGAWVSAVLPSRTGYLWIATPEGLVRFDGIRFAVFNRGNTPGLPADGVHALHESRDGRLWVGTSRGLVVGDARGPGPFERVAALGDLPIGSVDGADGVIWATTAEGVWRLEDGRATPLSATAGQHGESYRALRVDPSGGFWLATGHGLLRADGAGGATTSFTVRDGLPSDDVLSVLVDREGAVWVGTGAGMARRAKGGAFEPVSAAGRRIVMALAQDRDGVIWAATRDGLLRVAGGRAEGMGRAEGLPDEHTRALAEDADGNLWIGTEAGGLVRLRDGRAIVYGRAQGLTHEVVWTVTEGRDGTVWVATDGGGLNRLRDGRAQPATAKPDLVHENVFALLEDRSGRVWFSTESHGLCRLTADGALCDSVRNDELVRCVFEDREGHIWVGTSGSLFQLDGAVRHDVATEDGKRITVKALTQGADGVIWVGTSSGLARVEGGTVRRVRIDGKPHAEDVDAVLTDADGTVWIGTIGSGLQRLRGGHLATVAAQQGLPSNTVLSLLDDGRGRLWISSGEGIVGVARTDLEAAAEGGAGPLRAVRITEAEGLRDRECSGGVQPSAWRGRDGRLWFPTIAGVAVVDPGKLGLNTRPAGVLIEAVVADGQALAPADRLQVPAGTRHLEIHYTAPNFAAPERLQFQHRLEGLETTFFRAGSDRVAHYSLLKPGRYRFRAEAANEDGVWAEEAAALEFTVQPHAWQTPWFFALCAAALLAAAWMAFELRVRALRSRERELQRRVAEELAQIKVLRGLLPTCAWCRKVRDDDGYWTQIEAYVVAHSEAEFSHGICPECKGRFQAGEFK